MADAGVGTPHFAATNEEAPGIFVTEFEGLVSLAAQNVSVEVRPGDEVEVVEERRRVSPDSPRAEELAAQAQELEEFHQRMLASPGYPTLHKQIRYSSRDKNQGRTRPPEL